VFSSDTSKKEQLSPKQVFAGKIYPTSKVVAFQQQVSYNIKHSVINLISSKPINIIQKTSTNVLK